jgi:3',5'-cyclic-AMP phosphodiesterase
VLLAHLSDTHFTSGVLQERPAQFGRDAIDRINALDPRPDCVVLTGDLVDQGEVAEYVKAAEILHNMEVPLHVVPGNHDHAQRMLQALSGTDYVVEAKTESGRCYYTVDYPDVRLLCCDSSVSGHHYGKLGRAQLDWLDGQLAQEPQKPTVLAMHHHPIASGIEVMDQVMLRDASNLAEVLSRHKPLLRVLVGHLHRPMTAVFGGSIVISAPSTYRQVSLDLRPGSRGAYVEEPAAFMLHNIKGDRTVSHLAYVRDTGPPLGAI